MSDFFGRLASRVRGEAQLAQPQITSRYAPAEAIQASVPASQTSRPPEPWQTELPIEKQVERHVPFQAREIAVPDPLRQDLPPGPHRAGQTPPQDRLDRQEPGGHLHSTNQPDAPVPYGEARSVQALLPSQAWPVEIRALAQDEHAAVPDPERHFIASLDQSPTHPKMSQPEVRPAITPSAALLADKPSAGVQAPGSSLAAPLEPRPEQPETPQPEPPHPVNIKRAWEGDQQEPDRQLRAAAPATGQSEIGEIRPRQAKPEPPVGAPAHPPPVQIKIGRIEVHAGSAADPPQGLSQFEKRTPSLSLQDYLKKRSEAKR